MRSSPHVGLDWVVDALIVWSCSTSATLGTLASAAAAAAGNSIAMPRSAAW
jgi:hypothetical protein